MLKHITNPNGPSNEGFFHPTKKQFDLDEML